MDRNDELTIGARSKGWEIFSPQWDYLAEIPALELGSICAMSVGLHPYFASPAWVLLVAMPHFDGTDSDEWYPLEDAKKGAERAKRLKEFLKRAHVACANLAPLGHLPIAAGEPNSEKTVVRVADFAVWAASRGWELPAEFPKPEPVLARADAEPVPEEADSQLKDHEQELAELFDAVAKEQLETMFPDNGNWAKYAERAARNGLKSAAWVGRGKFNPFRAALWWIATQSPDGRDWSWCVRKLAGNLPPRSRDSKHLLTGDFD